MDTQISPQVRLIAIAGAVLAVFGGGFMFVMNRAAAAEEEPIPISASPLPNPAKAASQASAVPGAKAVKAAQKSAAKAESRKDATAKAAAGDGPAKAGGAPAAQEAAPPPPAEPEPPVAENGLPLAVARALARNEVVVVALFAPRGAVDALTVAEARAGARAAGAAFVPVNVLDETQGAAMARLLGLKEPPAVLVYQAPSTLAFQFEGFADYETIAQAAIDAGARGAD